MAYAQRPLLPRSLVHGDRTVTLRRLVPSDVDGLNALYSSLPPHDRYQRFFTEVAPRRRTVEQYVALLAEPGFGVVAVTGNGSIAGEAGYFPLASGDGEFGITVAADWRGLGSFLLDSILEQADQAGVPALQADVLTQNRAMLTLAAKRGYALIHTPDWTVLRITIGTATPVPTWPADTPRPRLLVETPAWQWRAAREADAAGFHIISCRGPSSFRHGRCPALHGQPCPLVEGSDAVVVALPADDRSRGALTPIHRFCHAYVPVFLQEAAGEARPAWVPDGMPTIPADASPPEVVEALQAAVAAKGPAGLP
jgi:GNAT superfamily N-acetyltransferase